MMTFIEYLVENLEENSAIMSTDALKLAGSKFDKLAIGKRDGSKPSEKRAKQVEKRSNRQRGRHEEDEESNMPAVRDRVKRITNQPKERGKQRPSLRRQVQRGDRNARSQYGIGNKSKNAMTFDDV